MIPLHPEPTDDPRSVRWIVPADAAPPIGTMRSVPPPLQALVDAGTVASVVAEPAAVLITLGTDATWRADGPGVRTALQAALAEPAGWQPRGPSDPDADLRLVAEEVMEGPTGDFVRSHGGRMIVTGVANGVVTLAAEGTCSHCPAVDFTLQLRVAAAIRKRYPGLVDVRIR